MASDEFAQRIYQQDQKISSYTEHYFLPDAIVRPIIHEGGCNSNSYMAGLLNSVMGLVPILNLHSQDGKEYVAPRWTTPLPLKRELRHKSPVCKHLCLTATLGAQHK